MSYHTLSDEEKTTVAAQVEYFVELLAKKYNVEQHELESTIEWVKQQKEFREKMRTTGLLSILGIVLSGMMLALWEGIRATLGRGG